MDSRAQDEPARIRSVQQGNHLHQCHTMLLREQGDPSLHPQGRALRAAVLGRQHHDGNRGTGLTLRPTVVPSLAGSDYGSSSAVGKSNSRGRTDSAR
jgi:hypothetical protein